MSLVEEAKALRGTPGTKCAVAKLSHTDPALHAELVEAMASDASHESIARALRARDVNIAGLTIARHRNGQCQQCR